MQRHLRTCHVEGGTQRTTKRSRSGSRVLVPDRLARVADRPWLAFHLSLKSASRELARVASLAAPEQRRLRTVNAARILSVRNGAPFNRCTALRTARPRDHFALADYALG
jgi:hypothetical protein